MPTLTPEQDARFREVMRATFYRGWNDAYFKSPSFESDMVAHTTRRFEECRDIILPWVERYLPLAGRAVVDIGCGTGASTAAWATKAASVVGYDIHGPSVEAAVARMDIIGLTNVRCRHVAPDALIRSIQEDFPSGTDVVIMYAVIEHQTIRERIDTLKGVWAMLRPGGLLVVGDTPGRCGVMDYHTSLMPFFQWLPEELAVLYANRSPRADFKQAMQLSIDSGMPAAIEYLWRSGRSVGVEEFELAIGDLDGLVVGDSFDEEMIHQPGRVPAFQDELMNAFAEIHKLKIPRAFLRPSLELILRKPLHPGAPRPPRKPAPVKGLVPRTELESLVQSRVAAELAKLRPAGRVNFFSRLKQWARAPQR